MRQLRTNKILGVAITPEAFLVAEIHRTGEQRELLRSAVFRYPDGTAPANLVTLGRPFAQFLRQHGFTASHAVFGLPANWIMARPKELPPSDLNTATNLLRLQAESEFSSDLKDLVYDFTGQPDRATARSILLLATPRARLLQISEMAHIARLNVDAITSSIAALATASAKLLEPEGLVVYAGSKSVELAFQNGHGLSRLRHSTLNAATVATAPPPASISPVEEPDALLSPELISELRRTFAGLPQNLSPANSRKLVLWNDNSSQLTGQNIYEKRLGGNVNLPGLSDLGLTLPPLTPTTTPKSAAGESCIPAMALALAALSEAGLPLDFIKPRLAAPKKHWDRKILLLGGTLAALLLLTVGYYYYDTAQQANQLASLKTQLSKLQPEADQIKGVKGKVDYVDTWKGNNTRYLNCLYYLTRAFPEDGSAWAISIDVQPTPPPPPNLVASNGPKAKVVPSLTGKLQGKATTAPSAHLLAERLKENPKFTEVKGPDWRSGERSNSREVSFSLSFTFVGTE